MTSREVNKPTGTNAVEQVNGAGIDSNIQKIDTTSSSRARSRKKDTTMSTSSRGGIFGIIVPLAIVLYHTNILSLENISAFTTKLLSTALPPPGPLPPLPTSPEISLQRFITPVILLYVALLIPAKTRFTQWLVSAVFFPAILYVHWGSLKCGSRSSAFGYAFGVGVVFLTYQSLDLLILSNPRKDFYRVPISLQREAYLFSKPIPPEFFEPYPPTLAKRIPWVYELISTMRFVGWHTPDSKPTTPKLSLLVSKPMPRREALRISFLRLIGAVLVIDFLVWNIRVNDTGYFFPQLLLNRNTTTPVSQQVTYNPNFAPIAIYPNPPTFQTTFPFISLTPVISFSPEQIPNPRYFPLTTPTKSSSDFYRNHLFPSAVLLGRLLTQTIAIYAAISGLMSFICLVFTLFSYLVYPPGSPPSSEKLKESRWFNPEAYPHPFQFSLLFSDPPSPSSPSSSSSSEESDSESDTQKQKQIKENEITHSYSTPSITHFWGAHWHILFRRLFLRPWIILTSILFPSPSSSPITTFLKLTIMTTGAFLLSGLLHGAGATTQTNHSPSPTGATGAGYGALTFFLSQSIYVIFEKSLLFLPHPILTRTPKPLKLLLSYASTCIFLFFSSPYIYDELRWTGLWRAEAAPWSVWQVGWFRWADKWEGSESGSDRWGWVRWSDGQGGEGWWLVL